MNPFNIESALQGALLSQSENEDFLAEYEKELHFYSAVQAGDYALVKSLMTPLDSIGHGCLSNNTVRNNRYHLIISIALITRFCLEGGMPSETAYTLSDLYIQKADVASTLDEIKQLHETMVFDYTKRMHDLLKTTITSKLVLKAIEFIHAHIHTPFTVSELADSLSVSSGYLSTLFKQESGMTITAYTQKMRIEAAQNMLKYSEQSFSDISNYLCFSSHSHFISVFKKYTNMTPRKYREAYFRSYWTT